MVKVNIRIYSVTFFFLVVSLPIITYLFELNGIYIFQAAMYSNRIWAISILVTSLLSIMYIILNIRINIVLYSILILGLTVWGLIFNNSISNVVVDIVIVFIIPILFLYHSYYIYKNNNMYTFLYIYKNMNIVFLSIISIPLFISNYKVTPDITFLLSYLLVTIFLSDLKYKVLSFPAILFILLIGASKTVVFQLAFGILFIALVRNIRSILTAAALLLALLLASLTPASHINTSRAAAKLQSAFVGIQEAYQEGVTLYSVISEPFNYLDTSTAHRVYELNQVLKSIGGSYFTVLFGKGLGATVDISGTRDASVILAHKGRQNLGAVRVVHIGPAYVLLKAGVLGLCVYIYIIILSMHYAIKLLKPGNGLWEGAIGLSLMLFIIGTLFSFSIYVKSPSMWILYGFATALTSSQSRTESLKLKKI